MSNIGSVSGYNFQPYEGVGYKEREIARPNKLDLTAGEDAQVLDPRTGTWGPAVAAGEGRGRAPEEPIDREIPYDPTGKSYGPADAAGQVIDVEIPYDPTGKSYESTDPDGQLIDVEIPYDPTGKSYESTSPDGQLIDVEIPYDPTGLYGSTPDKNETDKPASTHRTHLSSIR